MKRKIYSETILGTANQQERFERLKLLCDKKGFVDKLQFFMAGFFEGEGSLWISVNLSKYQKFGIQINFGFSVYQHESNLSFLELFLFFFKTGRIEKKAGSDSVYQFVINNRISLNTKVRRFISSYAFLGAKKDYSLFFEILDEMEKNAHLKKETLVELIKKIYSMSALKGKKRKRTLEEILKIINEENKPQKSSETTR